MAEIEVGTYIKILDYDEDEEYTTEQVVQIGEEIIGGFGKLKTIPDNPDDEDAWFEVEINEINITNEYDEETTDVDMVYLKRKWFIIV